MGGITCMINPRWRLNWAKSYTSITKSWHFLYFGGFTISNIIPFSQTLMARTVAPWDPCFWGPRAVLFRQKISVQHHFNTPPVDNFLGKKNFPDNNITIAFVVLFLISVALFPMLHHVDSDNIDNFPIGLNSRGAWPPWSPGHGATGQELSIANLLDAKCRGFGELI